ncbi:MAG: hypothetical protein KKB51_03410 [Candidatus Riflebacteria bacterium]|nr:hypothetical protein [Candidatus Riflebacteria bacterium]
MHSGYLGKETTITEAQIASLSRFLEQDFFLREDPSATLSDKIQAIFFALFIIGSIVMGIVATVLFMNYHAVTRFQNSSEAMNFIGFVEACILVGGSYFTVGFILYWRNWRRKAHVAFKRDLQIQGDPPNSNPNFLLFESVMFLFGALFQTLDILFEVRTSYPSKSYACLLLLTGLRKTVNIQTPPRSTNPCIQKSLPDSIENFRQSVSLLKKWKLVEILTPPLPESKDEYEHARRYLGMPPKLAEPSEMRATEMTRLLLQRFQILSEELSPPEESEILDKDRT